MRAVDSLGSLLAISVAGAGIALACSGSDGSPGSTGPAGADGIQGTPGVPGAQGDPGPTGDAGTVTTDSGTEPLYGCEAVDLPAPEAGKGIQVQHEMYLAPGQESEWCQFYVVGKDGLNVNSSQSKWTPGSHHGVVYATNLRWDLPTQTLTGEPIDPYRSFACPDGPTAVAQIDDVIAGSDNLVDDIGGMLPPNVAFKLEPGTVLIINSHMLNASDQPINACFKHNLNGIPSADVQYEAGTFFMYNPFITVPANGENTARMVCPVSKDITILTAKSHMHRRADNYVATLLDANDAVVQTLYENTSWNEPISKKFTGGLAVSAGHKIDYQCHYTNTENRNVKQGLRTTDEMCMFVGLYYPKDKATQFCAPEIAQAGLLGKNIGSGTMSCMESVNCWFAADSEFGSADDAKNYKAQSCVTQTCEKASGYLRPYLTCLQANSAECSGACQQVNLQSYQSACLSGACSGTAASAQPGCVTTSQASCTTAVMAKLNTDSCKATTCSAECATAGQTCDDCVASCVSGKVTSCVTDATTKCVTDAVTACVTDCVTQKVTDCTFDCLNTVKCSAEIGACAAATCN